MLDNTVIRSTLAGDSYWSKAFEAAELRRDGLHLAVLGEPYLRYILEGRKTVESRFSVHRAPPFGAVQPNDVLLLKSVSGPVVGIARVASVWFYRIERGTWDEILGKFGSALCLDNEGKFVEARSQCRFATLMRLTNVRALSPMLVAKRDRRGWVVLRPPDREPLLPGF